MVVLCSFQEQIILRIEVELLIRKVTFPTHALPKSKTPEHVSIYLYRFSVSKICWKNISLRRKKSQKVILKGDASKELEII